MNIIDLFSGVGGLSLGAARAGFTVAGSVEIDEIAIKTHKVNFPNTNHLNCDISTLNGNGLLKNLNLENIKISGIIGGPPCQGFSTIGKQIVDDKRNQLFIKFFSLVDEIQPDFFVAENVPGIMGPQFDGIRQQALNIVSNYNVVGPIKAKASDYGAATIRTRFFFIGIRSDLAIELTEEDFLPTELISATTVQEALRGLEPVVEEDSYFFDSGRVALTEQPDTIFHRKVRGCIPAMVGNAIAIEELANGIVYGHIGTKHTPKVKTRYGNTENGKYDPTSKSYRLCNDGYCPTLRAGTSKENGSFQAVRPLHPTQPRVITPREAARLQGFPDWFTFHETKWHSFRQIGNSVCPIVAESILQPIYRALLNA